MTRLGRFVTFAGTVGLLGAWQWLIVQEAPVIAVTLSATAGLVVGSRPLVDHRQDRREQQSDPREDDRRHNDT